MAEMELNLVLIAAALLAFGMAGTGYKRGLVKGVISLVSLVFLCAVVVLAAGGMANYSKGNMINVAIFAILLILLGTVRSVVGFLLSSAKALSKLPVVNWANKMLGILFGLAESVFIIWTVFTVCMMMNLGNLETYLMEGVRESQILTYLYCNNYLATFLQNLLSQYDFAAIINSFL